MSCRSVLSRASRLRPTAQRATKATNVSAAKRSITARSLGTAPRTSVNSGTSSVTNSVRGFHTVSPLRSTEEDEARAMLSEERAVDEVDVVIVGGGPAGLAAAIRLKQLDAEHGTGEMRVVVLEKAPDMGNHILSGAVLEPKALQELFPDFEYSESAENNRNGARIPLPEDLVTLVESEQMRLLTPKHAIPLPEPPQMVNKHRNFIVSLNQVVKYLAEKAEEVGVEVYPSISVAELVYTDSSKSAVKGVATGDMGVSKAGLPKSSFERGMEFHAKATLLAEGCHGSLSKQAIANFKLREGKDNQTYGLGIKEVWEVSPEKFRRGFVGHTLGYPLSPDVYGGGFMYHFGDGLVSVGLVVGLDYENPWISPYQEFQKMKQHPYYADVLKGGKCISYGARALNEGGLQSVPKLFFPGGALIGCAAGFMNVPKIKGTHNAMKSGMLAAESIFEKIKPTETETEVEETIETPIMLENYESAYKNSWIHSELNEIRNVRPSFHSPLKLWGGLAYSGIATLITKGKEPWTFHHKQSDSAATKPASEFKQIEYPKPDGELTFDILTSVSRTGTSHDEDERCHLRLTNTDGAEMPLANTQEQLYKHTEASYPKFRGVEARFCPAGVYEYVEDETAPDGLGVRFQINSQNCIHCKTCDIKVPTQDINWTVPEGGDGPKYYLT